MGMTARKEASPPSPRRASSGGDKPRILFVDDEKRVLNSMRALFRRDYELHLTTEGKEAVQITREHDIHVIVADQRMPGMSGVDVLGEVKTISPGTVRILLTGYADLDAIEGSINIGEVFRFLSKPCPPDELRATLETAVKAARATAAVAKKATVKTAQAAPKPAASKPAAAERPAASAKRTGTAKPASPQAASLPKSASPARIEGAAAAKPAPPAAAARNAAETAKPGAAKTPADGDRTAAPPATAASDAAGKDEGTAATGTFELPMITPDDTLETEIIMSGDTGVHVVIGSEESEARRNSISSFHSVGVVIFSSDPRFAREVQGSMDNDLEAHHATTLVGVTEILEAGDAGVLVTDFCSDTTLLQNMIGTLKQYLPELVTIVVSDDRDATDMITLINHGQIFRFLTKPVDNAKLRQNVNGAILKHTQLREHPELVERHAVVENPTIRQTPAVLAQFVGRLKSMRRLWERS